MTVDSIDQAREIAEGVIDSVYRSQGIDAVILDGETIEEPFGWVFFYQSRAWAERGEVSGLLVGNGPILVTRDGSTHSLGTGEPIDEQLRPFRE